MILLYLSNYTLLNLTKYKHILFWRILDIKENRLHLEGEDRCWLPREQYFYFCKIGNKTFYPKYDYYSGYDFITMYGIIYKGRIVIFDLILDIKDEQNLQFFLSYKDNNIEKFIEFIKDNCDKNCKSNIKPYIPLKEQDISKETQAILALIYESYFSTEEEKRQLLKERNEQINLKYNTDNLFKNKEYKNEKPELIVVKKQSFFEKIINKIKLFFHR